MTNRPANTELLEAALQERILVLDGAMGTMIQQRELTAADFGGPALEGCNEHLVLTRPDVIRDIHREYYEAGADLVETNTFGGTRVVLAEYDLQDQAHELNVAAVRLAREAAAAVATPDRPRFVAGSMGPTTKAITVTGGITFDELITNFRDQANALAEGGADLLLLETCQDTRNVKAALIGIHRAFDQLGYQLPVMVSGTIEPMGTMLAGQAADAFVASLQHVSLLSVGLNCATGPEFMTDHVRTIHELCTTRVSCYPNAGLPNEEGLYLETPDSLAAALERFVRNGWLNLVGGCCGTTPAHIRAIAEMVDGKPPRQHRGQRRSLYTGIELVEANEDNRPLIVGERTNEVGSRAFKRLISEEKFEEATEIGRRQVKHGAHIIDINLENTDRDELTDIDQFYGKVIHKVKVPLMIDSTNPAAVERALTYCQGKSIINSINFEDGEEKFDKVLPLVKTYGAAVIIGSIDEDKEQAQAITRERKLAIAQRAHDYCTARGIAAQDLVFDPLVFPCATGDENYIGSAVETIEAVGLIKQQLPECKTVLGISNVSFGLPPAAREVVNSVFLYHATKAGLDLAIVNAEKLERYASIPEHERALAENLLGNYPPAAGELAGAPRDYRDQTADQRAAINQLHIAAITDHFRDASSRIRKTTADLPLDERIAGYIIEGTKEGLVPDLDRKRAEGMAPLDIINGPLMDGMAEVGRLFNNNELIVAEVLQSAEAMKAAVAHLEQFMEHAAGATKGRIVLATVKGDVHDIGKNLVEIILGNNGYEVVNLGIKVPPEDLIRAVKDHQPNVIGLSGLLVKSAQQMVITAGDLKEAGITAPILVGGAALSEKFTRTKIAPAYASIVCYCKDAMTGLASMNQLMDPAQRDALAAGQATADEHPTGDVTPAPGPSTISTARSTAIDLSVPPRPAPYADRKVRDVPQLSDVWSYINPQMLYVRHLGFRKNFERALADRDPKALELHDRVQAIKDEVAGLMKVRVVWQFFECERDDNSIRLYPARPHQGSASPQHTFTFRRQPKPDGLCLADYVMPAGADGQRDTIAVLVTTAGEGVREQSERYKHDGEFMKSHTLQALALETAEAAAEWLHRRIREDWGFPDPADTTMLERFQARYRGKRYSFGYPACPSLEDQEGIWKLLAPAEIGVTLTEGHMMEPEASVSALVFHHPDCTYFSVGETP